MYAGKEKDILEYFPMALFSIAMIVRSGRSLEEGMKFVAGRLFGRVSMIFQKVLEYLPDYQLERCLASVRNASDNSYYKEAIDVLRQYALEDISISDRLVLIGKKMQQEAILKKQGFLTWVNEVLNRATGLLLLGIPFLFIVYIGMESFSPGLLSSQDQEVFHISSVYPAVWLYLIAMACIYPILLWKVTYGNPVFHSYSLMTLKKMFKPEYDRIVSDMLRDTADMIENGMSLEMAIFNALPSRVRLDNPAKAELITRSIRSLKVQEIPFKSTLLRLSAIFPSPKFALTCEFVNEAIDTQASVAGTLRTISEIFWSSHLTYIFFQENLFDRILIQMTGKVIALLVLGVLLPVFVPFFILFLIADILLYALCLT